MGVVKKLFGWLLLPFGIYCLLGCIFGAPYEANLSQTIGYKTLMLITSVLSFYYGWKWINGDKVSS